MRALAGTSIATLLLLGTAAAAEPIFGNINIGGGYNYTKTDGSDIGAEGDDTRFLEASGSINIPMGNNNVISLDGDYRRDYFSTTVVGGYGDNAPIATYEIGAHFTYALSPKFSMGGFYGYGDNSRHGRDVADQYNVHQFGLEARTILSEKAIGFGQFSIGYKGRDGEDAFNGYDAGYASRLGLIFALNQSTNWMIEGEYSFAPNMFEGEDNGKFYGASFSGETAILPNNNVFLTYQAAYRKFDSTTETDIITEKYIGIGLSFHFNSGSRFDSIKRNGSLGLPSLPNRASSWADEISEYPNDCTDPGTTCNPT